MGALFVLGEAERGGEGQGGFRGAGGNKGLGILRNWVIGQGQEFRVE